MFESPFGRAPKIKDKSIRSNLTYLDNNPVERHLVEYAEQYRWNYLAYAVSDHPYSERIILRKASMPLRRALEIVKGSHSRGRYLTCALIQKLFKSLPDKRECEQLTDYIISTYSVIDHQKAVSYFKSYEDELIAAKATTGSEYDINEHFTGKNDKYYATMSRILLETGMVTDIHDVYTMSNEKKGLCYKLLRQKTLAYGKQIASFLHYQMEE